MKRTVVAEKSDIGIINERSKVHCIAQDPRQHAVADQDRHEEELDNVEDEQDGHECVAVHIKGIAPFERLLNRVNALCAKKTIAHPPATCRWSDSGSQRSIGHYGHVDIPSYCCDDAPDEGEIDADHRQDELEDAEWAKAKGDAVHDGAH